MFNPSISGGLDLPNRRQFLKQTGLGFGSVALASILQGQQAHAAAAPRDPLAVRPPPFPARAKSVIWLFMTGAPSHVDTWDYKPELQKRDGQPLPGSDAKTGFFPDAVGPLMKSPFAWKQHGQSGTWASSLFPKLAEHADRMAFIH